MEKKTKVAILYSNRYGRNDGPPLYWFEALKRKEGLDVKHLTPEESYKGFNSFDLTFWVDWGEDAVLGRQKALQLPLPKEPGKTIYVASDTHLDDGYRFEKAKQFDFKFFNQKNAYVEYIKTIESLEGEHVAYLPHAAEPLAFPHYNTLKKYDLTFIGHIQEYHKGNTLDMSRLDVLDHLFKNFPNFYFGSRHPAYPGKNMFEDAAKKFCESKIVFNVSIGNDVNMRFFETLMTGSFLLTNKIPELRNIEQYGFKDGIHYRSYDSLQRAEELIKFFLENEEEREKIARAGYEQALKTGTYESRIKEVLNIVGGEEK